MTASEARKLIGKRVQWVRMLDRYRGSATTHYGVVEKVAGGNILISGDWKWRRDLTDLKEASDEKR